jgi:hypothetical protein
MYITKDIIRFIILVNKAIFLLIEWYTCPLLYSGIIYTVKIPMKGTINKDAKISKILTSILHHVNEIII